MSCYTSHNRKTRLFRLNSHLKKRGILLVVLCLGLLSMRGQVICGMSELEWNLYGCLNDYSSVRTSALYSEIVDDIVKTMGLKSNFVVKKCSEIHNAVAVMKGDGRRAIYMDESFMGFNNSKARGFSLFVLAHEIGHHLNGHTLRDVSDSERRRFELEADHFAGFVFGKYGVDESAIESVLSMLPHPKANIGTHPILADRLRSARQGFREAIELDNAVLDRYNSRLMEFNDEVEISENLNKARIYFMRYSESANMTDFNISKANYEALISDKVIGDLALFELSELYQVSEEYESALMALNQIKNRNAHIQLQEAALRSALGAEFPPGLIAELAVINSEDLEDLPSLTRLADYYVNIGDYERAGMLFSMIEGQLSDVSDWMERAHYRINYSYMLNLTEEFEKSSMQASLGIKLVREFGYLSAPLFQGMLLAGHYNMAVAYLNMGQLAELELLLNDWEALINSSSREDENYLYFRARFLEETSDFKGAMTVFREYLLYQKDDPYALFHLGKCASGLGDLEMACSYFESACSLGVTLGCRYNTIKCD